MSGARTAVEALLPVELAWVREGRVVIEPLSVALGSTVGNVVSEALRRGLVDEALLRDHTTAVFGRARPSDHPVHQGDRVELLGPVLVDPKVARARRVAHRRLALGRHRWRPNGA